MKKYILITAIGGDVSQCVATILRESFPNVTLIGVDVQNKHAGHLFVDYFEQIPIATDVGYCDALEFIIKKYDVDTLIPMTEIELGVLNCYKHIFCGAKLITPGSNVIDAGIDKLATAKALESLNLPIPWTIPVNDMSLISYPCILKRRFGSGSREIFKISNENDAIFFSRRYPDAIFQEILQPDNKEITCAVHRKSDGEVISLLMLRRLMGGLTGWAKVIEHSQTSAMCSRIAEGLDLKGSMNIQLRITSKGPRVFEINPRFSSTVLMRHRIGFTDVLWSINDFDGKTINYPKIKANMTIVRLQSSAFFEDQDVKENL